MFIFRLARIYPQAMSVLVLDVRYPALKTQSFHQVLKLNLNIYISVLLLKYWSSLAVTF